MHTKMAGLRDFIVLHVIILKDEMCGPGGYLTKNAYLNFVLILANK